MIAVITMFTFIIIILLLDLEGGLGGECVGEGQAVSVAVLVTFLLHLATFGACAASFIGRFGGTGLFQFVNDSNLAYSCFLQAFTCCTTNFGSGMAPLT